MHISQDVSELNSSPCLDYNTSQHRLGPEFPMSQRKVLNYWTCSYSDHVFFLFFHGKIQKKIERSWVWLSVECEFCNFKNFPGTGKLFSTQFTSRCNIFLCNKMKSYWIYWSIILEGRQSLCRVRMCLCYTVMFLCTHLHSLYISLGHQKI